MNLSDRLHRERRERAREIQYEREHVPDRPRLPPAGPAIEERVYEREVVYDYDGGYRRGYGR